jgi:PTH1 family peptidyl-tRNA hydrolase
MKLFVGLGNPGAKYENTRHNLGFMAVDRIGEDHGFGPWKSKFQALVSEGRLGSEKVILLKPQTFMNLSGQAVGEAMRFYKLSLGDIVVFHDEIDLAPAKCRVKQGGGHAGNNGLRSLHQHIGPDFTRVRLGVGHPGRKEAVAAYVLHPFAKADRDWVEDLLTGIANGAPHLAEGAKDRFMNAVALRTAPPRSSKTSGQNKGSKPAKPAGKPSALAPQKQVADPTPEPDPRSPLQRLVDKFR